MEANQTKTKATAPAIGVKKGTKTQRILDYLKAGFKLDNMTAVRLFQTTRLGSIIFELRKEHNIKSESKGTGPSSLFVYQYVNPICKGCNTPCESFAGKKGESGNEQGS